MSIYLGLPSSTRPGQSYPPSVRVARREEGIGTHVALLTTATAGPVQGKGRAVGLGTGQRTRTNHSQIKQPITDTYKQSSSEEER